MRKPHNNRGRGDFIEVKIVDQFNNKETLYKDRARMNDKLEVFKLLKRLDWKGVSIPKQITDRKY